MSPVNKVISQCLPLQHIYIDKKWSCANTAMDFLNSLTGPSVLHLPGCHDETRVITTLLYGDEPSGLLAIHQLLLEGFTPYANTKIILASVCAAQTIPMFSQRQLKGQVDLNRCFRPPYDAKEGKLAKQIIDLIVDLSPSCVIDLHDTPSTSPPLAITSHLGKQELALGSYFSHYLLHSNIPLGSIMEVPFCCPVVTVEAGGDTKNASVHCLYKGLKSLLSSPSPWRVQQKIEIIQEPKRLEIHSSTSVICADKPVFGMNITLHQDIERWNFTVIKPGDVIGWVDHYRLEHFRLCGQQRGETVASYFNADNNALTVTRPLRFFMITKDSAMAKADCLLYFIDINSSSILDMDDLDPLNQPLRHA
jgi:hypothetical protein